MRLREDAYCFLKSLPFLRLEFRRIGRQKEQMNTFRNSDVLAGMPDSLIEDKNDAFFRASSHSLSKMLKSQRENLFIGGGQEQPLHLTRSWTVVSFSHFTTGFDIRLPFLCLPLKA
jgi:hypothetical protein